MFAYGIPMHAFDYDKIGNKIVVREARKGEKFMALDGKTHTAYGGEIIFDNGKGEIIDLPGIMGTKNSIVTQETKNVLLVMEHMDPLKIREASLRHAQRTNAATLNEKDPDPNAIDQALELALQFFESRVGAKVDSRVFDWYPTPRKTHELKVQKKQIDNLLGVEIPKNEMTKILESLDFKIKWSDETAQIVVPTSRVQDVSIPEDIAEEIARIYGYFNLPSNLPEGKIPDEPREQKFTFERKVKNLLKGFGGVEVYTLSMVSRSQAGDNALKIKNPLGEEGSYMRTSLVPSLIEAAQSNTQEKDSFHMFEIANVYIPQKKNLPHEKMMLGGIFTHTNYRNAKGVIEALFEELNIKDIPTLQKRNNYFVYEYEMEYIMKNSREYRKFTPPSKYPPQVEDITIIMKSTVNVQEVLDTISKSSPLIVEVTLKDMYEDSYTYRIFYQDTQKTLTDTDVTKARKEVVKKLKDLKLTIKE
jgi:phenylalanyl-tRNA synthetase beta chain